MKLFYITNNLNADGILREGFRTTTGYYFTDRDWTGFATKFVNNIWLSSKQDKGKDFFDEDTLFAIEIPEDVINEFEVVGTEKVTREFLVPAALLNHYESLVVTDDY